MIVGIVAGFIAAVLFVLTLAGIEQLWRIRLRWHRWRRSPPAPVLREFKIVCGQPGPDIGFVKPGERIILEFVAPEPLVPLPTSRREQLLAEKTWLKGLGRAGADERIRWIDAELKKGLH